MAAPDLNPQNDAWEADLGRYRVIFGLDAVDRLGRQVRALEGSHALVVTDAGVRDAGHLARVLESLRRDHIEACVYDAVEANPTTRHVNEALEAARRHPVDCIVGLGGGSAMDCAKGVNFVLTNGGSLEDYWGTGKATRPMLPSLGVPTTAGSGSEAQSYALICRESDRVKMACGDKKAMFRRVVLDPSLPASAPREVTAVAGMDAVAHAVESHVSTRRNPVSRAFSREAWRLLESNLERVLVSPDDREAWGRMLVGAHLAGAAIEQSMLGAAHACANPLTARFPLVPHGTAVNLMLPHVICFNAGHVGALYDELASATSEGGEPVLLEQRVTALRSAAGLPETLRDYGVPRNCLKEMAEEASRQWTAGFNPRPVTPVELLELYEAAY